MAVYTWRTGTYSRMIYLDGTKSFASLTAEYLEPVKQRAATDFSYSQIDNALAKGYINQQEYDDTIAIKTLIEPRTLVLEEPTTQA